MKTIKINDLQFFVKSSISVLEACKYVGIIIPRFCYHETLSVAGNCRMCLVEVANSPKPVASCALPVLNNMQIYVDTPLVKKARENVLEILLLNHPLDCPICDQGGECDLQDQTKQFGGDYSRYFFNKRGVEDKYCGPLIKTIMTRCIHCTRCVRFGIEIAGVEYLGTLNRGGSTEIGGYLSSFFSSELSGNVIDLCPVGALTSKPYAFKARSWELRSIESVDMTDGTGSNTYVNFKESEIARILPKQNSSINDSIITDKARFYFDANKSHRLHKLFIKNIITSKFLETNWEETLANIELELSNFKSILFLVNAELDLNSLMLLNLLSNKYKNKIKIKSIDSQTNSISNLYISWIKDKISELNKNAKICFLFCSNIRLESAVLNSKLRLKYSNDTMQVIGLSSIHTSNFNIDFVNININKFLLFLEGKDPYLSNFLTKYSKPVICFGDNLNLRGFALNTLIELTKKYTPSSTILKIQIKANTESLGLLNIGQINTNDIKSSDLCFAVDLDSNFNLSKYISSHKNLIWLNTHGSNLALKAKIIIPLQTEFEEEKIIINLEEKIQITNKIISSIGNTRSFSKFINFFFNSKNNVLKNALNYNFNILENSKLFNSIQPLFSGYKLLNNKFIQNHQIISNYLIKSCLGEFYCSNKMTRNSLNMITCSQEFRKTYKNLYLN